MRKRSGYEEHRKSKPSAGDEICPFISPDNVRLPRGLGLLNVEVQRDADAMSVLYELTTDPGQPKARRGTGFSTEDLL